jgi:hypothetical protein
MIQYYASPEPWKSGAKRATRAGIGAGETGDLVKCEPPLTLQLTLAN